MEKKNKKLLLPRGYLSPSQYLLWNRDRKRYIEQYFYGGRSFTSKATEFGSIVAKLIEDNELPMDVPRYEKVEEWVEAEIEGVVLRGRIDMFCPKTLRFRDDKTGKRLKNNKPPWSPVSAYKNEQLLFYGVIIRKLYGKYPRKAWIDWLETVEDEKGDLSLTGHVESFECPITKSRLDDMQKKILETASAISGEYEKALLVL